MAKRIAFIIPYPFGEAPSQRFRFEQYLDFLKNEGNDVELHPYYDYRSWQSLYGQSGIAKKSWIVIRQYFKRFILLFKLIKVDVIFIHREAAHIGPPIFEWLITKVLRKKYIYDFDDAIWLPNYSEGNAKFHRLKAYWKVKFCIKWAHKVTAGNDFLAQYALKYNRNTIVLPTTIDTENYHNKMGNQNSNILVIGWTGTHTTMHYLDDIIPVLQELEQEFSFEFHVISNEKPNYDLNSLKYIPWNKETEIDDLSAFSIGIMPLKDTIWAKGKCGFKGLQYMALQIPTIMSPVGVNESIISDGQNGFLAKDLAEWKTKISILLQDSSLRNSIGKAGRKTVIEKFSVSAHRSVFQNLLLQN
jgi:glycosyltransferase involved in cell wall biosynthesis